MRPPLHARFSWKMKKKNDKLRELNAQIMGHVCFLWTGHNSLYKADAPRTVLVSQRLARPTKFLLKKYVYIMKALTWTCGISTS